jgi:hypothetical protein
METENAKDFKKTDKTEIDDEKTAKQKAEEYERKMHEMFIKRMSMPFPPKIVK